MLIIEDGAGLVEGRKEWALEHARLDHPRGVAMIAPAVGDVVVAALKLGIGG